MQPRGSMYAKPEPPFRTPQHPPRDLDTSAARLRYRSSTTRHNPPHPDHTYYDGGDLSPYCLESLLDLIRAEARLPYEALSVEFEIAGPCPPAWIREVSARFSELSIHGVRVCIRAEGHSPLVIATKMRDS